MAALVHSAQCLGHQARPQPSILGAWVWLIWTQRALFRAVWEGRRYSATKKTILSSFNRALLAPYSAAIPIYYHGTRKKC